MHITLKYTSLFFSLIIFGSFGFKAPEDGNNTIRIRFTNIEEASGYIGLGLYDKPETFPKPGKHKLVKRAPVKATGTVVVELTNIEDGTYAIAASHDIDGDNTFDMLLGIPQEPFGFSNNVRHAFSAPTFDECKFEVHGGAVKNISIRLD